MFAKGDGYLRDCASNILDVVGTLSGVGEYLAGAVGQCKSKDGSKQAETSHNALCASAVNSLVHHTTETSMAGLDLTKACSIQLPPNAGAPPGPLPPNAGAPPPQNAGAPQNPNAAAPLAGAPTTTAQAAALADSPVMTPPPAADPRNPPPATTPVPQGNAMEQQVQRLYNKDEEGGTPLSLLTMALGAFLPITIVVSFVGGRVYAQRSLRTEDQQLRLSENTPREIRAINLDYVPQTPRE